MGYMLKIAHCVHTPDVQNAMCEYKLCGKLNKWASDIACDSPLITYSYICTSYKYEQ